MQCERYSWGILIWHTHVFCIMITCRCHASNQILSATACPTMYLTNFSKRSGWRAGSGGWGRGHTARTLHARGPKDRGSLIRVSIPGTPEGDGRRPKPGMGQRVSDPLDPAVPCEGGCPRSMPYPGLAGSYVPRPNRRGRHLPLHYLTW